MKKKAKNKDVEDFLRDAVEKIYDQIENDYLLASNRLDIAEHKLAQSLNQEQLALYEDFCQAKQTFIEVASQLYTKKSVPKKD